MTNGWKKLGWKPSDRMQSYGYHHHHRHRIPLPRTSAHSEESCFLLSPSFLLSLLPATPSFFTRPSPTTTATFSPSANLPLFFAGQFHLQAVTWHGNWPRWSPTIYLNLPHRPSSTASSFVRFRRPLFPASSCNCNFPCFARRILIRTSSSRDINCASRIGVGETVDGINN